MVIADKYKLREVAGESVILKQGRAGAELTKIIALNESARMLYERFAQQTFTIEMVAEALTSEYGIDEETALKDAKQWVDSLKTEGVIME